MILEDWKDARGCGTHLSGPPRHGQAQALKPRLPRCRGRRKKGRPRPLRRFFKEDLFFFCWKKLIVFFVGLLDGDGCSIFSDFFWDGN